MPPFNPLSSRPTAARSRVGTSVIASFGQAGFAQSLHQAFMDRAAGTETVGAAAQDHGVAGFQAQHAGVGRDIGAAFENHGDDAERHADALDGHAVRALPAFGHDADGIGDVAHGHDAVGHRVDARLRQRQAIDEGGTFAAGARFRDILGIGGEDRGGVGADGALHRIERLVFLLRRRQRQHPRGGAGAGGKIGHQGRQIGVSVDRLQRRGHIGLGGFSPVKAMS